VLVYGQNNQRGLVIFLGKFQFGEKNKNGKLGLGKCTKPENPGLRTGISKILGKFQYGK
jgi:hypothetical protein